MNESAENKELIHPILWTGEGTVPELPGNPAPRGVSLLRFAAGTAAVALAVGIGGGVVIRDHLGPHESGAGVDSAIAGQAAPPAPVPAPAPHGEDHEESD